MKNFQMKYVISNLFFIVVMELIESSLIIILSLYLL